MSTEMDEKAYTVIDCGESVDIRQVNEYKAKLCEALEVNKPVSIDASAIEKIDTAGLQLLCAFVRDAQTKEIEIQWHEPSQIFIRTSRLAGLSDVLQVS